MTKNKPRHARPTRKRSLNTKIALASFAAILATLLLTAIIMLAALGIIGPSAGHAVAPGPSVVCYAVYAPAYCPVPPSP